jgi:biotin transporter BioY
MWLGRSIEEAIKTKLIYHSSLLIFNATVVYFLGVFYTEIFCKTICKHIFSQFLLTYPSHCELS